MDIKIAVENYMILTSVIITYFTMLNLRFLILKQIKI